MDKHTVLCAILFYRQRNDLNATKRGERTLNALCRNPVRKGHSMIQQYDTLEDANYRAIKWAAVPRD